MRGLRKKYYDFFQSAVSSHAILTSEMFLPDWSSLLPVPLPKLALLLLYLLLEEDFMMPF
jgi:hypothetical protein